MKRKYKNLKFENNLHLLLYACVPIFDVMKRKCKNLKFENNLNNAKIRPIEVRTYGGPQLALSSKTLGTSAPQSRATYCMLNGTVVSASLKRSQFEWQSEYSYAMTELKKICLRLAAAPNYPVMCYVSIRAYLV
jgi:hypothetical protein